MSIDNFERMLRILSQFTDAFARFGKVLARGRNMTYQWRTRLCQEHGLTANGKLRPGDKAKRVFPKGKTLGLPDSFHGKSIEYWKEHVSYVIAFNAVARIAP